MVPLPYGDGEPVDPGEYLHAGADLFNERRSDENGFEGRLIRWIAVRCGEWAQLQRSREAVDLPPEGVSAHGSVQEADARLLGMIEDVRAEQDKPRTRAEYGHSALDQLPYTAHHAPFDEELAHDRALASGEDKAGKALRGLPSCGFPRFRLRRGRGNGRVPGRPPEWPARRCAERTLRPSVYQPRSCIRCSGAMVEISSPGMASPRSRETSARIL